MSTASESAVQPPLEAKVQGYHVTAGMDAAATTLRGRCVVFYDSMYKCWNPSRGRAMPAASHSSVACLGNDLRRRPAQSSPGV